MWPFDRHRHRWTDWQLSEAERSFPWSEPRSIAVQVRLCVECNYMDWRKLGR